VGRPKSPLNRREYARPAPASGAEAVRFRTQLRRQAEAQGYTSNIGERQFRRSTKSETGRRGDTGDNLVELLERRLGRRRSTAMKLVPTPFAATSARQSRHVHVNRAPVTSLPTRCRDGDRCELTAKAKGNAPSSRQRSPAHADVPDYGRDRTTTGMRAGHSCASRRRAHPVTMEPNLVIEYYSRMTLSSGQHPPSKAALRARLFVGRICSTLLEAQPLAAVAIRRATAMLTLHSRSVFFADRRERVFCDCEIALVASAKRRVFVRLRKPATPARKRRSS